MFNFGKISTDEEKINSILTRGVDEVIQKESLEKKLKSGKKLRVKLGIDPTSPNLHIGRSIPLLKLKDFQELGHQVIFIVGDATGVIGDTSDKESERPMLSKEEVKKNAERYFEQAGKILDLNKVEKHYNSRWLDKLSFEKLGELADQFSVADFIARDNIKRRLDKGTRVSLREVLYPLMQGYDSIMVKADVELGGTDQRFNLLAGRTLQEKEGQEVQDIIMTNLILGLDGRKMSSSYGNVIAFNDTPEDMYGKIMSLNDDLVEEYLVHCTRVPMKEIEQITYEHPKEVKMRLAKEIVSLYHGVREAEKAGEHFTNTFTRGEAPEEVKEVKWEGEHLVDILLQEEMVASKTEFRRLVENGAITIIEQNKKVDKLEGNAEPGTYKIGKKRFIKITV